MLEPTFNHLENLPHKVIYAGAVRPHGKPRFYKYYWWVFTAESPVEGDNFLTETYRLSHAEYDERIAVCRTRGMSAMVYNKKCYRTGADTPWDKHRLNERGACLAPSFNDDTDPVTSCGYK